MEPRPEFGRTLSLLQRAREGDEGALHEVLEHFRPRMLARVRLMMGPQARRLAESGDFLQGVMVELLQDLERVPLADEPALLRWMTHAARNNIRDAVRKRRERALESFTAVVLPGASVEEGGASPSRVAMDGEEVQRLVEAMEGLSADHARVIELRDFDGLPYKRIAEEMERPSEEAVQMLHARAMAKLSAALARHDG